MKLVAIAYLAFASLLSGQPSGAATRELESALQKVLRADSFQVSIERRSEPGRLVYTYIAPDKERTHEVGRRPNVIEEIVVDGSWFVETSPGSGTFAQHPLATPPLLNAPLALKTFAASIYDAKGLRDKNGAERYSVRLRTNQILSSSEETTGIAVIRDGALRRLCVRRATTRPYCIAVDHIGTAGPVRAPDASSVVSGATIR
jgi:hypothetical protein